MKMYVFEIEIEQEEDGIWEAEIPVLPGCAVWAYSKKQTIEALEDCVKAYLEVKQGHGDALPAGVEHAIKPEAVDFVSITV